MASASRPDTSPVEEQPTDIRGHTSAAASAIVAYWLADGYVIGLPVAALAAIWNPLIVFLGALTIVISINLAACRWIDTAWSSWAAHSSWIRSRDTVQPSLRWQSKLRDSRARRPTPS